MGNCIDVASAILKNERKIKGEPKVHCSLVKYKNKESYEILTDMSENVTLAQFMDSLVNLNRAIIVVGHRWTLLVLHYPRNMVTYH